MCAKKADKVLVAKAKAYRECTILNDNATDWFVGIDEVGWGCFAGDIVLGAVAIHRDFYSKMLNGELLTTYPLLAEVNDSKVVSADKRAKIAELIRELSAQYTTSNRTLFFGVGHGTVEEINTVGMVSAYKRAFERAVTELDKAFDWTSVSVKPGARDRYVLLDGDRPVDSNVKHATEVKADGGYFAVGCASIFAKVYRDTYMEAQAKIYPGYHWEKNKGYGTPDHINGLKVHGATPLHRKQFIKNFVATSNGLFDEL